MIDREHDLSITKQAEVRSVKYEEVYLRAYETECAFRLKDLRRFATRYNRLARTTLASVSLATALVWWI